MVDLNKLSDAELDARLKARQKGPSLSTLTDEQLDAELLKKRRSTGISEVPQGAQVTPFPQLLDTAKRLGTELLAESPALAGAGLSAMATAPTGPLGMIPAAIAGGVVGKLTQEGVEQGLLATGILEEGERLISEQPLRKKGLQEVLEESQKTGLIMGAGEAGGQALIAPFTKLGRGFSRNVTPEGKETLEFFRGTGITPNPAKVTDSRILDLASNAGEASIFGGEKFLQGQIKAVDYIDDTINRLVGLSSKSRESLGDLFSDAITESSIAFREAGKTLFKRLDEATGTNFVNTAKLRLQADKLIDELTGLNVEPSLIRRLQEAGETSLGPDALQRTGLRFSEAQRLRSDLLAITRKSENVISDKATGRIKLITKILEREMEATAKSAGGDVLKQWRRANSFWKEGRDTFDAKIIKDLIKKDPDAAVSALFTAAKDKPVMIRRIKRALKDKTLIRDLENSTLKTILFRSTNELGDIVPTKLLNQLKAFGGVDGQALKAMFPRGEDKVLAKLARIKGVVLKGQPDATGRFAVQIGQVTAGVALVSGQFKRAALAILIVPDMIARAFRNPRIVRFITEGAKARPGTKAAVTFTTRLSALLAKEGINHQIIEGGTDISPTRENAAILEQQQQQQPDRRNLSEKDFKEILNPTGL